MSVDADTVRRIAHLARIAVAEDEIAHLQGELNAILAFVEQLERSQRARRRADDVGDANGAAPRDDVITDGGYPNEISPTRR